jgi:hypothetical protein
MSVQELIKLVERRIANISSQYTCAEMLGDIERMSSLQDELTTTQHTLEQLRTI